MKLIRHLKDYQKPSSGVALAIGNFDGFHLGHKAVIECMLSKARRMGLVSAVMIFEPQPLEFFSKDKSPARLYSLRDKLEALKLAGVQLVFCMKFDAKFASMTGEDYVYQLLANKLGVKSVTVGTLFNFGKQGSCKIDELKAYCKNVNIECSAIDGVDLDAQRISSTKIREYLKQGRLDLAKQALGRPYSISGVVTHGNEIGRTISFPTANVNMNRKVSPIKGVFAVKVLCQYGLYDGMANLGLRPTVNEEFKRSVLEVNIFNFKQDLYGQSIRVYFVEKIRDERKFDNFEQLQKQLLSDKAKIAEVLSNNDFLINF